MAYINLLPWREGLRQAKKKEYIGILGLVALLVLLLFYLIGTGIDMLTDNQRFRNQYMEQQIAVLDSQIAKIREVKEQKAAIEQQMALIEQLQTSRNVASHVLDELARIVPAGVSFKSMTREGNRIEVAGQSESNNRLAEFMRQLQNSTVFDREDLSSIRSTVEAGGSISEFEIVFFISESVAPKLVTETAKSGGK